MQTLITSYPSESEPGPPAQGKFLQLSLAGRDWLLFAATDELRYHNQILARFLAAQGIPHRWQGKETLLFESPELTVIGGGRFRFDATAQALHVWDESSVYGRFNATRLRKQLAAAQAPWGAVTLAVD